MTLDEALAKVAKQFDDITERQADALLLDLRDHGATEKSAARCARCSIRRSRPYRRRMLDDVRAIWLTRNPLQ